MAWLLDMTRAEKEQYVCFYKQNRTVREIAKLMHMSFGEIGKILKKFKKEAERERGHTDEEEIDYNEPKSKESQAFKLFSEGMTPVQVVIALDIPPDEVHGIYREYLELNGMYDVLQIYDQIRYSGKYSLPSFLKLHRIVNDLGMGEQQIINVLDLANHNQLEYLQGKSRIP
jgi:DNA-binding Lrp family transcriptional regulator